MPVLFIPHGGGPCFFMDWNPPETWQRMGEWLRGLAAELPKPKAVLMISGHWEEREVTVQSNPQPSMLYDYSGFPPHTYQLQYPAPGAAWLTERVETLLGARRDPQRGFDHGTFIPLMLVYPEADIPAVQVSLRVGLDPAEHLEMGRKLAVLRDEGVLIIGSGMSFHNLRAFGPAAEKPSTAFDTWLTAAVAAEDRNTRLAAWEQAPSARFAHPREEHLIPLMVAAGAAGQDPGTLIFTDQIMGAKVSAYRFG